MTSLSVEEPKELSEAQLLHECRLCENRMTSSVMDFVEAKFDQGVLLRNLIFKDRKYGADLMGKLVADLKESGTYVNERTLYTAHAFAAMYDYDKESMQLELDQRVHRGLPVNYGALCKRLELHKNPDAVGGMENHADLTAKKIETLGVEVSEAMEIHQDNPQVMAAADTATDVLRDGAEWLLGNTLKPGITKQEPLDLPHYRAWIRTHPCVVTGSTEGIEAHHLILKARGNAALDIFCLPMSSETHKLYHAIGHAAFERENRIDTRLLCMGFIQEYVKSHP